MIMNRQWGKAEFGSPGSAAKHGPPQELQAGQDSMFEARHASLENSSQIPIVITYDPASFSTWFQAMRMPPHPASAVLQTTRHLPTPLAATRHASTLPSNSATSNAVREPLPLTKFADNFFRQPAVNFKEQPERYSIAAKNRLRGRVVKKFQDSRRTLETRTNETITTYNTTDERKGEQSTSESSNEKVPSWRRETLVSSSMAETTLRSSQKRVSTRSSATQEVSLGSATQEDSGTSPTQEVSLGSVIQEVSHGSATKEVPPISTTPPVTHLSSGNLTSPLEGRLSGRHVLITGGTSGIGLSIAKRFVLEGADQVVIVGRSAQRLADAIKYLQEETGLGEDGSAHISGLVGDVSDRQFIIDEIIQDRLTLAQRRFRKLDTLVNCAGISQSSFLFRPLQADFPDVVNSNLLGTILVSQAFAHLWWKSFFKFPNRDVVKGNAGKDDKPQLLSSVDDKRGIPSGCIINIGSLLGSQGGVGATVYAASKAGVVGFTRALAAESAVLKNENIYNRPLRVNAIVPGYIETPMIAGFEESTRKVLYEKIPMGRFGTPDEVADAAVFLTMNEYANNCVLNLDGGLSAS